MPVRKSPLRRLLAMLVTCAMVMTLVPNVAGADEQNTQTLLEPDQTVTVASEPASTLDEDVLDDVLTTEDQDDEGQGAQEGQADGSNADDSLANDEQDSVLLGDEQDLDEIQVEVESDDNENNDDVEVVVQDDEAEAKPQEKTTQPVVAPESNEEAGISYRSRTYGSSWSKLVSDGAITGLAVSGAVVNAFRIKVDPNDSGVSGGVKYRMHTQNKGWQSWVQDDATGGTDNRLQIEAMQIKLYGNVAKKYDVYYSVRVRGKGWLAWAKNGQSTGSTGKSLAITGLRVQLVKKGDAAPSSSTVNYKKRFIGTATVKVKAHVQKKGWKPAVGNGKTAGTTGQRLGLEALSVSLANLEVPGGIELKGHVETKGWTGWQSGFAGTVGKGKRMEAVAIRLTGEAKKLYDVYYRAHVSNLGWMAWTKNGKKAGTTGFGAKLEAVQIYLVKKGSAAPSKKSKIAAAYYVCPDVCYKTYCQDYGWKGTKKNGAVSGTTSEQKRVEAMSAWLSGGKVKGSIKYKTYVAGSGWKSSKTNGDTSGTVGKSKAVQAIKISLTGHMKSLCDVYYKVYMPGVGWLGWAKNGETAGAPGVGKDVQAIQVRLVARGAASPGSTAYHVVNKSYFEDNMTKKAQGYSSPTGWLILVDTTKTMLGVYRGSYNNWQKYGSWRISCGQPETPTKKGVFSVGDRGYVFGHGYSCYWYVQWYGSYLFHSIKYYEGTFKVMDGRLGEHISMGCVRMEISRAKWIYDNIPSGTTVVTY